MNIAMFYAKGPEDIWSTPIGIHRELENRGHLVHHYNLFQRNSVNYSTECVVDFLIKSGSIKYDVVFQMDFGQFDSPLFTRELSPSSLFVLEAGDDPQRFVANANKIDKFDIVLTPDYQCSLRYKEYGKPSFWWPQHADTGLFRVNRECPIVYDCVTTCGPRGNGLTEGIKNRLGLSFTNTRYLRGKEYVDFMCSSKMVFQCSQYKEITRRIFEGAACGKLVITDRLQIDTGIGSIFTEDKDIVYYDSLEEAVDKIRYYLKNDRERERIAIRGLRTVHNGHAAIHRVDHLEEIIYDALGEKNA